MKKYILMTIMSLFTLSVFSNTITDELTSYSTETNSIRYDDKGAFYLRYAPGAFVPEKGSSRHFDAVGIGYLANFFFSDHSPLFFEMDLSFQYTFYSKKSGDLSMFSDNLAVGLGGEMKIPDTSISIVPKAGLDLGLIMGATLKSDGKSSDLFSSKDMGSKEATWNRFLLGTHIGIDFHFGWFLIGCSYQYNLTPIATDLHMRQTNLYLGYIF